MDKSGQEGDAFRENKKIGKFTANGDNRLQVNNIFFERLQVIPVLVIFPTQNARLSTDTFKVYN